MILNLFICFYHVILYLNNVIRNQSKLNFFSPLLNILTLYLIMDIFILINYLDNLIINLFNIINIFFLLVICFYDTFPCDHNNLFKKKDYYLINFMITSLFVISYINLKMGIIMLLILNFLKIKIGTLNMNYYNQNMYYYLYPFLKFTEYKLFFLTIFSIAMLLFDINLFIISINIHYIFTIIQYYQLAFNYDFNMRLYRRGIQIEELIMPVIDLISC